MTWKSKQQLKIRCKVFPVSFPDVNLTRKMHALVFDVPKFIKKFKTIGLLNEEEGESLHNSINRHLRTFACVRNSGDQMTLVIRECEKLCVVDRSYLCTSVSVQCVKIIYQEGIAQRVVTSREFKKSRV